ncbi:MAG: DUF2505 domain-containing protein [Candidatus Magnetomorum sp.]|nr:DUF2505 domain-containing protein [Candidatus Magnetomorum sp.]
MGTIVKHKYPYTSDAVYNMLLNRDYVEKKYPEIGFTDVKIVYFDKKDDTFVIQTRRDIVADIPGFAKKFIQPKSTLIQTDTWVISDDPRKTGTVQLETEGLPVRMNGRMQLQPTDDGCLNVFDYEIKVNIPLIGGRLARFLEEQGMKSGEDEYVYNLAYLKEYA